MIDEDEMLTTILEKEESSVEDLVPIPTESEGISDSMCDVSFCDNFTLLEASKDHSEILLDSNDDYSSSDDDSLYSEDIDYVEASPPESELISLEEVKDFDPENGEIDTDILLTIKNDILREKFDSLGSDLVVSFPSGTRNKIFDPGIFIEVQSKRFLSSNEFSISFIRDPLSPVFDTLLLFSSKNEDNDFNSGILASNKEKSPHLLSHRGFKAFQLISKSPMMIYEEDIPILDVPIALDFEASRARGFVLRSLELHILSFIWEFNIQAYRLTYRIFTKGQKQSQNRQNQARERKEHEKVKVKVKKAQQLEPKLYDGNVIKNTSAIVIPDSEETLMLAEESRSKMLLKQKDPMMLEKKVNTTPVDYANYVNSPEPTLFSRPTKVEESKKELTPYKPTLMGSWWFEHTKACFKGEIIPFVKALKDLFNTFDQYLIDELSEVQNVFHQMEQAVEQHRLESKTFEVKMNQVLNENERLLEQVISKDIVNTIVNSSVDIAYVNVHECEKCLKLETELLNKKDFVEKEIYDKLSLAYIKHKTQEEAAVLRDLVDHVRENYPLHHSLKSACRYTKLIQELLTNICKTCPSINNSGEQLVATTPKNKNKRVRFTEPVTSSGNTIIKTASTSNQVSNKPILSSTGVKPSTSASGSQPSGKTKKDKIRQTPSSTQKNKVEAHPRKVKSSLKNKDCVVQPKGKQLMCPHSNLHANS
ncbi:hypothetical protein Tco_0408684 [Tanacetum coccineum]